MKNNQKGFSLIEGLLIVVVIGIIAGVGWFVWDSNKKTDEGLNHADNQSSTSAKYIKATDSANSFSFEYPENWKIKPYIWEDCCEGTPKSEPDWSKQTKPITLYPADNEKATISLSMLEYGFGGWESYEALKAEVKEDYFAKILFDGQRADKHSALFSLVDYLGPPDAKVESFTDHRYYYDNGKFVLFVDFREKYHHDWPDNETGPDINNTKFLSDFEHIANSVNFLN